MTTDDQPVPPALFEHCLRTYKAMLADATNVVDAAEDAHMIVYEGFLTTLITQKLNLSVPYYSTVRRALLRMGCIRQLKRGGGSSPSQWELIEEPTLELFENAVPKRDAQPSKFDILSDQYNELALHVSQLEAWQQSVNEMLAKHFGVKAREE